MSKTSLLVLALLGATLPSVPALAAPPATPQEAERLKALFERYVGSPAAGEPARVTVTPEGTGYRTVLDVQQMMRPLEAFGLSLDPATETMVLTPNDNGTWHVTSDTMPPLVMHLNDQTIAMKTSTYAWTGTYDPKLGAFTEQTATQDGATLDQDAPALSQHRRSGHAVLTQMAVPAANERVDTDVRYAVTDITAEMTTRTPTPKDGVYTAPPSTPVDITYAAPAAALDVHIGGLRGWSLLDLWAFFVAHPSREAITASQEDLRTLLRAALPLFSGLKEGGSVEALTVGSPVGAFKVGKMAGALEATDPAGAGHVTSALTLDGLSLPSLSLPPWSIGFLPTSVDLRPSVTGLHLDDGTRAAVDGFDLKHEGGFTPEQGQTIGHAFWPGDGKVTLAPSHITAPLLDLRMDGEATIGAVPAGHLTVSAAGLDKAIASLQDVAATDPVVAQVMAQLVAAKNLAKPSPDGSLVWVIEAVANGPLSVNGVPLR